MPGLYAEHPETSVQEHQEPKSYAAVAALDHSPSTADSDSFIDEDLIKESPPRSNSDLSAPRPLGDILDEDEDEEAHESTGPHPITPTPIRKPSSGRTFAEVAAANRTPGHKRQPSENSADGDTDSSSHRSPLRRVSKRIPSHTLDGGTRREVSESMSPATTDDNIIHEKFDAKGTKVLATVKTNGLVNGASPKDDTKYEKQHSKRYSRDDLVSGRKAGESWSQSA